MKKIITAAIFLVSISSYATIINEYQSFSTIAPENFTGEHFVLNSKGTCELVKRKATSKYKTAKVTSREVVALSNCKMELIAKEIRSQVKSKLCHNSKNIIESVRDTDTTFFKRGHELIVSNKLTDDCLCVKSTQVRKWASNSENIFLHPLNTFFNGPTTKGKTQLENLDYQSCSDLASNEEELRAIQNAYDTVEERLSSETE